MSYNDIVWHVLPYFIYTCILIRNLNTYVCVYCLGKHTSLYTLYLIHLLLHVVDLDLFLRFWNKKSKERGCHLKVHTILNLTIIFILFWEPLKLHLLSTPPPPYFSKFHKLSLTWLWFTWQPNIYSKLTTNRTASPHYFFSSNFINCPLFDYKATPFLL